MARPLLADPEFVAKAAAGRSEEINTCIGCNQACLDHIFNKKRATCLVNPRACYETELVYQQTTNPKRIAVVGAGPAGLAFATIAAERGHSVTLYDKADEIGGQFNLAKRIPGKVEFEETLRYFNQRLGTVGVKLCLSTTVTAETLSVDDFDLAVLATGVVPRTPDIEGIEHPSVISYVDAIKGARIGTKVAIIGAGGIGFDVAELVTHHNEDTADEKRAFFKQWGVDASLDARGGIEGIKPDPTPSPRQVYLLQRKTGRLGAGLGKTTGWIHRSSLKQKRVTMLSGCQYKRIDDQGLHLEINGETKTLQVDSIIVCAGQDPQRELMKDISLPAHLIGGADIASELDAKRAIRQASELAARI